MTKLFHAFAGDKAEELWNKLDIKAPQLTELCHSPLLLQFIVLATLHGDVNQINTITKVLKGVLDQLQCCVHAKGHSLDEIKEALGRMAYNGLALQNVVFTTGDLEKEGLNDVKVQDFVIKGAQHSWFPVQKLFEGNMIFYFMHQMLQEIFAAIYICMFMPDSVFNQIVHQVVNEGRWSMVRRFMCGILLGNGQRNKKSERFFNELVQSMNKDVRGFELVDLLVDFQECSNDVKDSLAKFLTDKLIFYPIPISVSAVHALAEMLPRFNHPVERLFLAFCDLNSDSIKLICEGIDKMKYMLGILDLSGNDIGLDEIRNISSCLNKVKELRVRGCGITKRGRQLLEEDIKNLNHSPQIKGDFDSDDETSDEN
uniref:Uncharacterized protein LOC100175027 n=1 Tax=Phallusia mammillata TaxID=59560 RepID=A0A6F9DGN7_9ASCI|nr:uncharacterized protein LOC100175027 [Phallusia mammillata]